MTIERILQEMVDGQENWDGDSSEKPSRPIAPARLRGWKKVLVRSVGIFLLAGTVASVAGQYLEVKAGRGGEPFRSMWGYKVTPIGILVGTGAAAGIYPMISAIGWLYERSWRRRSPSRR